MKKGLLKRLVAITLIGVMGITTLVVGDTKNNTVKAAAITADYRLLLQQSLKFYDANMCGNVKGKTQASYRSNCHTGDAVVGGFHDAGDHMKFGITEAYSALVLEMSMDTDKSAYQAAGEVNHHKVITDHFADYLYNCATVDASGNVTKYCVQIGDSSDHSYWGSPEKQTGSRTAYYATSSVPCTDVIALSAAALALHYKNYGDTKYLTRAKQLFAFAKKNNKDGCGLSSGYYDKQDWKDDYCLAAIVLYNITGDSSYETEYSKYNGDDLASYGGWYLCWGDVKGAIAYYANKVSGLKACADKTKNGRTSDGLCIPEQWGSLRYTTSSMYMGLMYDRKTNTKTYQSWADGQMKKILGDNSRNICFVVGYNQYSVSHPHHRAASGYDWNSFNNNAKLKYTLTGALVGGPSSSLNGYVDKITDYTQNEVAIDYNATLVASAAALYTSTGKANSDISSGNTSGSTEDVYSGIAGGNTEGGDSGNSGGSAESGSSVGRIAPYYHLINDGGEWINERYYRNGEMMHDCFFCDGVYTYYLETNGAPMKDRLTYHPDGVHVIYFDENGHEVFSNFAHVRKAIAGNAVDDFCFFDVFGYMYVDVMTYDQSGKKLYYVNPYGQIERKGWFKFSSTAVWAGTTKKVGTGWGYGQADGSLMVNKWTYNKAGKRVYMQGDGHMK